MSVLNCRPKYRSWKAIPYIGTLPNKVQDMVHLAIATVGKGAVDKPRWPLESSGVFSARSALHGLGSPPDD